MMHLVIDVMLSSTVSDLLPERSAVVTALTSTSVLNLLGVTPVSGPSYSGSPFTATVDMAEQCHLYLLLLGGRYGYVTAHDKSATELEFDAAYRDDPTKILVFKKRVPKIERKQAKFIDRVTEYHKGYYVRSYNDPSELADLVKASFQQWLEERAAVGKKLHYFDHFIRMAVQRSPFPGTHPSYAVEDDHLELKYHILGKVYAVHFDKAHIYNDFWGSIVTLEKRFEEWRRDYYGKRP